MAAFRVSTTASTRCVLPNSAATKWVVKVPLCRKLSTLQWMSKTSPSYKAIFPVVRVLRQQGAKGQVSVAVNSLDGNLYGEAESDATDDDTAIVEPGDTGLTMNEAIEESGGLTTPQGALLAAQWAAMGALCFSCVFIRHCISGASALVPSLSLAALSYGETAQLFGMMISSTCTGWFSDKYGRRMAVLLPSGILAAGGIMSAIASTDTIFVGGRLLVGLATGSLLLSTHCLACETASSSMQQYLMGFLNIAWCFGALALIPLSFAIPLDWRLTGGLLSAAAVALFASLAATIPESPRWLCTNRKDVDGAAQVLAGLGKRNGKADRIWDSATSLATELEAGLKRKAAAISADAAGDGRDVSSGGLFGRNMRLKSTALFATSVVLAANYWALSLGCHAVEGSLHMNAALNWGAELPPALVVGHMMGSALGRRGTTILSFIGAGAACAAVLVAPAFGGTATALSKLLLLLAYSSVYTLAAEMYPTALRAGGLALARIGDGIGSFAASALLGCSSPFIVLTCTALLAGLVSTGFPETKDMEMQ